MPKKNIFSDFEGQISKRIKGQIGNAPIDEVVKRVSNEISIMVNNDGEENIFEISTAQMYRYLRGDTPIPFIVLRGLARSFGFSIDALCDSKNYNGASTVDLNKDLEYDEQRDDLYGCFDKGDSLHFYFSPIHEADIKEGCLVKADWKVDVGKNYKTTLDVPAPHSELKKGEVKLYTGFPWINKSKRQMFVNFENSEDMETFHVIMNYDVNINLPFTFAMGLALSVRSLNFNDGDRIPVIHRFCLTRKKLSMSGEDFVKKQLDLRRKLDVDDESIKNPIRYSALWKIDKVFYNYLSRNGGFEGESK